MNKEHIREMNPDYKNLLGIIIIIKKNPNAFPNG